VSTLVLAARADAKLVRSGSAVLSDPCRYRLPLP